MAEFDLNKQMEEAAKERSNIAKTLLTIQQSPDKLVPTVSKMEPVLASLEPAVKDLSACRPGVDAAVRQLQTNLSDTRKHLGKIATRSSLTGSSSTMAPSRCSGECLVHDDDLVQPMSATSNESDITSTATVDINNVDHMGPLPTGGSTSSPLAIKVVVPPASDVEDVHEDALRATRVCSTMAHPTYWTSGLGPSIGTIQAAEATLFMATCSHGESYLGTLPIFPWSLFASSTEPAELSPAQPHRLFVERDTKSFTRCSTTFLVDMEVLACMFSPDLTLSVKPHGRGLRPPWPSFVCSNVCTGLQLEAPSWLKHGIIILINIAKGEFRSWLLQIHHSKHAEGKFPWSSCYSFLQIWKLHNVMVVVAELKPLSFGWLFLSTENCSLIRHDIVCCNKAGARIDEGYFSALLPLVMEMQDHELLMITAHWWLDIQDLQQMKAVFEAHLFWERHKIGMFWLGVVPSSLMSELPQKNSNEKPKYIITTTSCKNGDKLHHISTTSCADTCSEHFCLLRCSVSLESGLAILSHVLLFSSCTS